MVQQQRVAVSSEEQGHDLIGGNATTGGRMSKFKQYSVIRSFAATTADGKPVMEDRDALPDGTAQPPTQIFITRDNAWRIQELDAKVIDQLVVNGLVAVAEVGTAEEAKYPPGSTRDPRDVHSQDGHTSAPARPAPAPRRTLTGG